MSTWEIVRLVLLIAQLIGYVFLAVVIARDWRRIGMNQGKTKLEGSINMDVLRVSSQTDVRALAGCIAGVIREHGQAEMQAIGAGAVNQATKAIAIAREFLVLDRVDVVLVPSFTQVVIGGQEKSAIRFVVEARPWRA